MFAKWIFIAALAVASSAAAQEPERPATAEEIAAARAFADRLIADADAGEFFENVTSGGAPEVRHMRSGLVCLFETGAGGQAIRIFPTLPGGSPRGDDVSCTTQMLHTGIMTFATRYPDRPSAEEALAGAIRAVRTTTPNARPHEGDLSFASVGDGPPPLIAGFDIDVGGRKLLSLIQVIHVGEWSFKQRATGPADDPTVNVLAAIAFVMAVPTSRAAMEAETVED